MPVDPGTLLQLIQATRQRAAEEEFRGPTQTTGRALGGFAQLLGQLGQNVANVSAEERARAAADVAGQTNRIKQFVELMQGLKAGGVAVTPEAASATAATLGAPRRATVAPTTLQRLFGVMPQVQAQPGLDVSKLVVGAKPVREEKTPGNIFLTKPQADAINVQARKLGNESLAVFTEGDNPTVQIEAALRKPTKDPGQAEELSLDQAMAFVKNRQIAGTKGIVSGENLSDLTANLGRHTENPKVAQAILDAHAKKEFGEKGFLGFGGAPRTNAEILAELAATAQKGKPSAAKPPITRAQIAAENARRTVPLTDEQIRTKFTIVE